MGKAHVVRTTLLFVENAWQVRMAFTVRIGSEIDGRTIHSTMQLDCKPGTVLKYLERDLENEVDVKPSIVIVDEIGMILFRKLYWVVRYFWQFCSSEWVISTSYSRFDRITMCLGSIVWINNLRRIALHL
ncbi:hypothetical protein AVEN_73737-1 [Araneus ventricosus]|uniref:Uncharacterized protein n=1 Tax=Araneus ventricosus TaxID=182803 RepID=A0A4Y2N9T9_ARAVE|nr:hypothetical protein AVEN_73737-1 [Araneus ventricosus]